MDTQTEVSQKLKRVETWKRHRIIKRPKMIKELGYIIILAGLLYIAFQEILTEIILGTNTVMPMLYLTLVLIVIIIIVILILHNEFKTFSHPLWVLFLGITTTFIGFTLSTSFQEYLNGIEAKKYVRDVMSLSEKVHEEEKDKVEQVRNEIEKDLFNKKPFIPKKQYDYTKYFDIKKTRLIDADKIITEDITVFSTLTSQFKLDFLYKTPVEELYKHVELKTGDTTKVINSYLWLLSIEKEIDYRIMYLRLESYGYTTSEINDNEYEKLRRTAEKEIDEEYNRSYNEAIKQINNYVPEYDETYREVQEVLEKLTEESSKSSKVLDK